MINLICEHLSPLSSLSYMWRDDTNLREDALSLGSNNAGAEQSPVLADDDVELPLQLQPSSWSAEVIHLALGADFKLLVGIFAAVAPGPCDETQQDTDLEPPTHFEMG